MTDDPEQISRERRYIADLAEGGDVIVDRLRIFNAMAERYLGAGFDVEVVRYPGKMNAWMLYAEGEQIGRRPEQAAHK